MSRKVAFGGILTGLCIVLLYMAAFLPTGKLGFYALTSVTVAIAVVELDIKWGTLVYAAAALLLFLLTGNINAFLVFTVFFGLYPLLKYFIERQRNALLEMLLKFAAFNLLGLIGYYAYWLLFGLKPLNDKYFSAIALAGVFIGAQFAFLTYDYVLSRLIDYYVKRIKAALNR